MLFVDMHTNDEGQRILIVFDPFRPELNRIEEVSDERFAEFLQRVLDTNIPVSGLEEEYAA